MRYSNINIASFAVFLSIILVAAGCDRFQPAPVAGRRTDRYRGPCAISRASTRHCNCSDTFAGRGQGGAQS